MNSLQSQRKFPGRSRAVVLGATMSLSVLASAAHAEKLHCVRISASDATHVAALALKATFSEDYGAFVWQELPESEFKKLQASGMAFEEQISPFALRLAEQSFDPQEGVPAVPANFAGARNAAADLRLVQFKGPTRKEWLDALQAHGVRVVQYIHPHTYVVTGGAQGTDLSRAVSAVRWVGNFEPAYRVLPRWWNLADDEIEVHIVLVRDLDTRAALQALSALGGKLDDTQTISSQFDVARIHIQGSKLSQAAAIPGVYSVQPVPTDGGLRGEMSDQVCVNNVNGSNQAFPGYPAYLAGVGINGAGVIIANVDGGVQDNHPALINRMVPCSGSTCGGGAASPHGTHTAGTMAADGSGGVLDAFGFLRGLGMAPGANLVEQVYSPTFTQPGGMLTLMVQSRANGALLSGNSWGPAGSPRGYDNDTLQCDIGVRDADPNTAGDQPLTFVLSIMNGNGGTSTQGTPDEGKNLFTIGSTKMQNSGGSQILQINDISSNSAHGPCLDGRKIPHMVAPGCNVDSTVTGSSYGTMCGTSMASPHVSGAVALFIQYYRGLIPTPPDPSPAMVKAAFLVTARDLSGNLDADNGVLGHPFDSKQGWGRMNTAEVIDPTVSMQYFDNPQIFDNTGEQWTRAVSASDPSKPVKVMLVWTDAPGHGLGGSTPAWNNDLDLIVDDGSNTYRGNAFAASGWSQASGVADNRNNTEGVFIGPTAPGAYTVRVVASNINSNGLPNQGDATDQDFALVCWNCAQDPGFVLSATPSSSDICAPAEAVYSVNVGQIMGFTDPVTLSATGNPAGTTVQFTPNPVTPPSSANMSITNTGSAVAGTYTINITGTSGSITRNAAVTLNLYTAAPAAPTLNTPANGAVGVAIRPNFTWSPAAQSVTHAIEIALDSGFTNIIQSASGLTSAAFTPGTDLAIDTIHYWRVRSTNPCGKGSDSTIYSFRTRAVPSILLVDDDDNGPDVRSYYTATLAALGKDYDVWDTANSDNEPTAAQMSPYHTIIWFTGDEFGGSCGPGAAGEAALAAHLASGRCLFISSQDYLWDRGGTGHSVPTAFMQTYLGMLNPGTSDVSQSSVTGAGTFAGLGPYALTYPFTNFSDRISPDGTGALGFTGNAGNAAISKDGGTYRSMFLGFPLEAVPNVADRAAILGRALSYCSPPCAGELGDMTAPTGKDARDISGFLRCYLRGNPIVIGCSCADMNSDGILTEVDIAMFVDCELGLGCP